jgi:hypothetical protein
MSVLLPSAQNLLTGKNRGGEGRRVKRIVDSHSSGGHGGDGGDPSAFDFIHFLAALSFCPSICPSTALLDPFKADACGLEHSDNGAKKQLFGAIRQQTAQTRRAGRPRGGAALAQAGAGAGQG